MAPLEWKDDYSVGIPAVDHEHRELIGLVNQLHQALASEESEAEVAEIFGDLFRAISSHFALEERFMRQQGYDQTARHKADHERLLDELRDIMDDHRDRPDSSTERLTASVEAWFATHFKTHDARLHSKLGAHPH